MASKGFLNFIDEYEKSLDDYIREDVNQDTEDFMEDTSEVVTVKKVAPKPVVKAIQKPVAKPVIKESSIKAFSFCSACGQKAPSGVHGKFCSFCGSPSMMSTNGVSKIATKKNGISETVDYASNLLDDSGEVEESRLEMYLKKNPVRNSISEAIKSNRQNESVSDHASSLIDDLPPPGGVKLLEMPDFSRFMPPKPKVEIQIAPTIPMAPPMTGVDSSVAQQMAQLGLI